MRAAQPEDHGQSIIDDDDDDDDDDGNHHFNQLKSFNTAT